MRTFLKVIGFLTVVIGFISAILVLYNEWQKVDKESATSAPIIALQTEQPSQQTSNMENQASQLPTASLILSNETTNQSECYPPDELGLVHLSESTEPPWSVYIWGSENMLDFITDRGIIDASELGFGEFQIWIGPCEFQLNYHGFEDGDRFWPRTLGEPSDAPPIYLGKLITITLRKGSGPWGLGKKFRLP